ncbi:MAG: hypothetical protein JNL82_35105 [Myxococcales bacterium]|nr:hypothetical protein [Myxococcales bacterium]
MVCVAECVGGGGNVAMCVSSCDMMIPATMEQAGFADALVTCGQQCV